MESIAFYVANTLSSYSSTSNNQIDNHFSSNMHNDQSKESLNVGGSSASYDSRPDLDNIDSKLNEFEEKCIMIVFLLVIVCGFFGNILVIWTVIFNKHMRTTSNMFILNLAISDLTLCIFSIPFNAYKTLRHSWIFGSFMCKFAPFFQATNVFVSTMSITAIALDR
jgi:hypothetical protein